MKVAAAKIKGITPLSWSRYHDTPKLSGEHPNDYEKRTWREKAHIDAKTGNVAVPAMTFKYALDEAAQRSGIKIPGRGNATWTKLFVSGVIVMDDLVLPVKKEDLKSETFMCHADGKKTTGTRVPRTFPFVYEWGGVVTYFLLEDSITKDVFASMLERCGQICGVGRFRPSKGGSNGRFLIEKIDWRDQ